MQAGISSRANQALQENRQQHTSFRKMFPENIGQTAQFYFRLSPTFPIHLFKEDTFLIISLSTPQKHKNNALYLCKGWKENYGANHILKMFQRRVMDKLKRFTVAAKLDQLSQNQI